MERADRVDLRVMELMSSRLCHDLISSVSAVNNGIELLTEFGEQMDAGAADLVARSARAAADKLQLYRLAFGPGGGDAIELEPSRQVVAANFEGDKTTLDWPVDGSPDSLSHRAAKLLVNMVMLAAEALPRGGELAVRLRTAPGGHDAEVTATGQDAGLRDVVLSGLSADTTVDDLTPRSVQAYYAAWLGREIDAGLAVTPAGEGVVVVSARLAAAA